MRHQASTFLRRFLLSILLAAFLCPQPLPGKANYPLQAGSLSPQTPSTPVKVPDDAIPISSSQLPNPAPAALENLPPLRAVVFVGPIDGENGSETLAAIKDAQGTASALRSFGVNVQEFYPNQPDGTWENIKNAARGAHFLIYRGHGVYWTNTDPLVVGGFALKDTFVSSDMIRSELQPAYNFIVMLYACFSAGSSSIDPSSISLEEARRRVEMYSDPFFDIGAGGYYADWYGDAFTSYVTSLLQGKTQRQAYESFYDYNSDRIWRGYHQNHPGLELWLGWDNWYEPLPNWNNAFAGDPDKTLSQLFVQSSMMLSTNNIVYLAEKDFPKRTYQIQIRSTTSETFNWTADVSATPAWLTRVEPLQGISGEYLTVEIDPGKVENGGSVSIHIETDKPRIQQPAQDINVTLMIVPEVIYTYLPAVAR